MILNLLSFLFGALRWEKGCQRVARGEILEKNAKPWDQISAPDSLESPLERSEPIFGGGGP